MEMEFTYKFEAAHRFMGSSSPKCMTPHGHTWWTRLKFVFESNQLNSNQMMTEFALIKEPWREFIDSVADHSFFHNIDDPIAKTAASEIPGFRGLPFPGDPTTEMISIFFLDKARQILKALDLKDIKVSSLEIQETPTNMVSIDIDSPVFANTLSQMNNQWNGWWQSPEIQTRGLEAK